MCAIFGILGRYESKEAREAFDRLSHRGPDDSHLILRDEGAWGVHRLAIASAGEAIEQPFEEGGEVLLFNGEIYNVRALADELGIEGDSESRVLLAAWRRWGAAFVERLRGMYAIAILRPAEGKVSLFRDPSGKKPLFYLNSRDFFAFASEAKALYTLKPFHLERRHLIQYLGFQSTIAPHTLDREVKKMEPGEHIEFLFEIQNPKSKIQNSIYDPWLEGPILYRKETSAASAVEEALDEAVASRIPQKVEWGVLLSGGLDSSLVAALAANHSERPLRAFSVSFSGYDKYDEAHWAEQTVRHLGAEHRVYPFGKREFFETLEALLPLLDEPLGDPAMVPLFFLLRQAAKEGVRVVLGGEGSDELFLGYRTYPEYFAVEKARELPYRNWLRHYFRAHYSENKEWEWYKRAWEDTPIFRSTAELYTDLQLNRLLRQNVRDGANLEAIRPWLERFEASKRSHSADWYSYLDLKVLLGEVYLVKQDRVSMAAGIEARSPFLDRRVIETAFAIDPQLRIDTAPKGILKMVAQRYLPAEIVHRKKKGLNYPFIEWILEEDGIEVLWRLQERSGLFNEEQLEFLARGADRGKFRQHLFPLYLLAKWLESRENG
ncbi:asparagine synthase (glutamine-hydrolyzing) [Nitratifractor salsuginis]|uniref:asparagine synthase (glutamine-hydrolyzing) n=1 Tax=Nitratifractor salsuginis (strain DSM 16511 / JCM 12458 / E9I37-1) TaxID=749222 RepID=E6X386_NITSE|nr:asparagine synthase (glutamine-hydrolyzing) [Nitratifractor salsuginis]ADV47299.1 asparagine synthase (glutamine-hydrolyzing) [Nitratifractor salsuginis DSM 16511]